MPHLVGRCTCGRKIHLPRSVKDGYQWKCHSCGRSWIYHDGELYIGSARGLHWEKSKPPQVSSGPDVLGFLFLLILLAGLLGRCQ
jgi:hypothetical protein